MPERRQWMQFPKRRPVPIVLRLPKVHQVFWLWRQSLHVPKWPLLWRHQRSLRLPVFRWVWVGGSKLRSKSLSVSVAIFQNWFTVRTCKCLQQLVFEPASRLTWLVVKHSQTDRQRERERERESVFFVVFLGGRRGGGRRGGGGGFS